MPNSLPQWSDSEDGFHVDYAENDKVPLEYIQALSGNGTFVEEHRSTKLDKVVAVKKMETYSNKTRNEKLSREVAVLCNLRHYHSIRFIGSYTYRDWFGILTEPVATCDLKVYLAEPSSRKVANMDKLVGRRDLFLPQIMGCLAYGLLYIHKELRIRHRDLKPANILLEGTKVLFADFGLSKTFTDTQSGTTGPSLKTPMVRAFPTSILSPMLTPFSTHRPNAHLIFIGTSHAISFPLHVSLRKSSQYIKDELMRNSSSSDERRIYKTVMATFATQCRL